MRTNYGIGTVSVTNGSKIVMGLGVLWRGTLEPGDQFKVDGDAAHYQIDTIDAFNQLTLLTNYAGVTRSEVAYLAGPLVVSLPAPTYTVNKSTIGADGSDYVSISGLPNPAQVTVEVPPDTGIPDQPTTLVTDGEFRMTTTIPGQYTITVHAHDYADFEVTIDADPA